MSNSNPWREIPEGKDAIPVFDEIKKHDFLWAIGKNKTPCLCFWLKDASTNLPKKKDLPSMRGVEVFISQVSRNYLVVNLLDINQTDIFSEFCWLLINACIGKDSEQQALDVFLKRCWRWHTFLSRGSDQRLTKEQQKGLIGELYFLSEILFKTIGQKSSISTWQGPTGSSKDFELSNLFFEIKAKRSGAKPLINISSEDQLELIQDSRLLLAVFGIDLVEGSESMTITQWCEKIEKQLSDNSPSSLEQYFELLSEAGFDFTHDYSDTFWTIREIIYYEVNETFPKVVGSELPAGVENVMYSLDMNQLKDFEVTKESVLELINETNT